MLRYAVFLCHNTGRALGFGIALGGPFVKLVIYLLLWALIFVLCVLIGARNGQLVEFNYLIAMGEYQLATLLGVFLVLGFCIGAFTLFLFNLRTRIKLRFVSSERDKLKKKLENSIHSKGEPI
ncbi:DUF1049 domain-containing protein [Corallincola luteus]|uniref:Probable lipopolysaccharide assembly protein A n=2 Tax=Corallincola TaxID=1775176 RepID=A0ABY1WTH6_9GAMM|nr:DUF1049 domain-containing protein [Corallincola spongiicola]TCI03312.1 DUF1049 domain-containing protein [Corallincola luteus]